MKYIAMVEAMFPELRGPRAYVSARGDGSRPDVAIGRAFDQLLSHPNVKRQRYTTIKATIAVTKALPVNSGGDDGTHGG
jgi:hypothetical protein